MKRGYAIGIIFLVIAIDQITKQLALANLSPYHPQAVLPMFNLTLAFNTGAAFSFLSGAGSWHRWFFAIFTTGMSAILFIWLWRIAIKSMGQAVGLALIIGGALGNLIDRVVYGHVIDFIDVYFKNYHWPVFNIADSAICIGAVVLFLAIK